MLSDQRHPFFCLPLEVLKGFVWNFRNAKSMHDLKFFSENLITKAVREQTKNRIKNNIYIEKSNARFGLNIRYLCKMDL